MDAIFASRPRPRAIYTVVPVVHTVIVQYFDYSIAMHTCRGLFWCARFGALVVHELYQLGVKSCYIRCEEWLCLMGSCTIKGADRSHHTGSPV